MCTKTKLICWTFSYDKWSNLRTSAKESQAYTRKIREKHSIIKYFPFHMKLNKKGISAAFLTNDFICFNQTRVKNGKNNFFSIENHMCVVFSITVAVQPVEMILWVLKNRILTASERNNTLWVYYKIYYHSKLWRKQPSLDFNSHVMVFLITISFRLLNDADWINSLNSFAFAWF